MDTTLLILYLGITSSTPSNHNADMLFNHFMTIFERFGWHKSDGKFKFEKTIPEHEINFANLNLPFKIDSKRFKTIQDFISLNPI